MNLTGIILIILFLLPVSAYTVQAGASEQPAVLIVIPGSDRDTEALESVTGTCTKYQIPFQVTSPEISSDQGEPDIEIIPFDSAFSQISENSSLVIIGGENIDSLLASPVLVNETRKRFNNGNIIGALDNGILFLGEAGVLNGTRVPSLQDSAADAQLITDGAVIEASQGVIDGSVITAVGPDELENFTERIIREMIAEEITDSAGILYLGDLKDVSTYVIPQRIRKPVITGVSNGTIVQDWNGSPFTALTGGNLQIPTGKGDWVLTISSKHDVCVLYEQFTGLSIPFGTVMYVDNSVLGTKRDFSTNTVPVAEIFQDITFKDVYQNSPDYVESDKTLERWTDNINNMNISVKETVASLYDDIVVSNPRWINLNAEVCIDGKDVGKGILDILQKRGDIGSSVAYDTKEISGKGCYEILLKEGTQKGSYAFLTVYSKDGQVLGDKEIQIP